MGRNSLDDFIRPMSSLWPDQKCQPSKMFAAWESSVSRTPQPFLPPWETEGRCGEQTSPCSCPRDQVWFRQDVGCSTASFSHLRRRYRWKGGEWQSRPLEGFHLILQSKNPPRPGSKMAPICTLFHGQEDNRPTQSPSGSHGGLVQEWPL